MQLAVISKAICMSPTTLARRAKAGRFNTLESDRLVALVSIGCVRDIVARRPTTAGRHLTQPVW
ncbi:MAG: hypothetical protein ACRD63_16535 [Pyrinomonadaceae bacterium]